jgi:1-phosphatidylinositol-3-phosphate 5-kinase
VLTKLGNQHPLDSARLLGGTFTFKGLSSPGQHKELSRLLRFAVYTQLSMVLEQHFLKDSHVQLKIPRPRAIKPSISQPAVAREQGRAKGVGFSLSNWWSKKRTPDLHRGNSIDLGSLSDLSPAAAGIIKLGRRFSIMGDYRQAPPAPPARTPEVPFSTALKHLKANKGYLSTSAGVTFDPPLLLDHLAEKEKENPKWRLKGDEKVGLRALLGWEGRETHGKGMGGLSGFVRQQEISVLVSQHVPTIPASPETPGEPCPPETGPPLPTLKLCGKPRWKTYCYFSAKDDESFGEAIIGLISSGSLPCEEMSCGYPRGRHQMRHVHAGVRINVRIDNSGEDESVKDIQSWESCAECGAKTPQSHISDASWCVSYAVISCSYY